MPEEIHTYKYWKELGYQVQKGETAKLKFKIWVPKKKSRNHTEDAMENDINDNTSKCYLKTTAFFTIDQTKKDDKKEICA